MDRYITPNEAARMLGLSPKTVRHHLRNKHLAGRRQGVNWRIRESDVTAFAARQPGRQACSERQVLALEATIRSGDLDGDLDLVGFSGFIRISELKNGGCSAIPQQMGVYVVVRRSDSPPVFRSQSIGGWFRGRNPTVDTGTLRRNWVPGADILYIGKTGALGSRASLRSRISAYVRFGRGRTVAHWGGRLIWQLSDCDDLMIAWKPLAAEAPRLEETKLLSMFRKTYGALPFANLVS